MKPDRFCSIAALAFLLAACGTTKAPPAAEAAPPPVAAKPASPKPTAKTATPDTASKAPAKTASPDTAAKAPAKTASADTAKAGSPDTPPKAPAKAAEPAKAPPAVAAKAPATKSAPAATPAPEAKPQAAAPAPLDLKSLEERLKETSAIGVLTKLSLKNQVDDLIQRFRAYHAGARPPTLPQLRPAFELLLMKVLSLLQDKDPGLARDVDKSRDAIWGVLTDKQKLAQFD